MAEIQNMYTLKDIGGVPARNQHSCFKNQNENCHGTKKKDLTEVKHLRYVQIVLSQYCTVQYEAILHLNGSKSGEPW